MGQEPLPGGFCEQRARNTRQPPMPPRPGEGDTAAEVGAAIRGRECVVSPSLRATSQVRDGQSWPVGRGDSQVPSCWPCSYVLRSFNKCLLTPTTYQDLEGYSHTKGKDKMETRPSP